MKPFRLLVALLVGCTGMAVVVDPTPAGAAAPGAPTGLTVTAGVHQLTVDWDAPVGGADRYVVRLLPTARQITTTSAGPVIFDRLVHDAEYRVTVSAVDDVDGFGGSVNSDPTTPTDDPTEPPAPIQVDTGEEHGCVLFDDGSVRCWGRGSDGQLGYVGTANLGDDEPILDLPAVDVGARAVWLALGDDHSCVITTTGTVRCWGKGNEGRLGYGDTANVGDDETPASVGDVDVGATVVHLSAGPSHTCAVTSLVGVRCWGWGGFGQLGYGDTANVGDDETPASVGNVPLGIGVLQTSGGFMHTCAVTIIGSVRCWGEGDDGRLGYGTTNDVGGGGGEPSPDAAGDVPLGAIATSVGTGLYHSCALTGPGGLRCWGRSNFGQVGYGNTSNVGDDETPASVGDVSLGAPAAEVSLGNYHTCAVTDPGGVRCWGWGAGGVPGYASTSNVGDDETPASMGDVSIGGVVETVTAGGYHSCVILTGEVVRCWGQGGYGRTGQGSTADVGNDETPGSVAALDFVTAPGAPGVTTDPAATTVAVTFAAPGDDGGATITSYDVTAAPGGSSASRATPGEVTLSGLDPETGYTLSLTATNSYGTSAVATVTVETDAASPDPHPDPAPDSDPDPSPDPDPAPDPDPDPAPDPSPSPDPDPSPSPAVHRPGVVGPNGPVTIDTETGLPVPVETSAPDPTRLVAVSIHTSGGTWAVDPEGNMYVTGNAPDHGGVGHLDLNQPVLAMTPTATGDGYWMAAADGGLFAFGDAGFFGSVPGALPEGATLARPITAMSVTPTGQGYVMVASDGGVFAFGDATFHGSIPGVLAPGQQLNSPINGLAVTPSGAGYWMVAADGGVFAFGDATFHGSLGDEDLEHPIVGMIAHPSGDGYWLVDAAGSSWGFGAGG